MPIRNIAGYKFTALENLTDLKQLLLSNCLRLKGTILLSQEGININLAGTAVEISAFKAFLHSYPHFNDIRFHESSSPSQPFKQLKIKIKQQIITMRSANVHPELGRAPDITPQELKQWLDEQRDITLLDTRNDYEVRFGTFKDAVNPQLNNFSEFSKTTQELNRHKPVVMFCTGGIRCEKAALHLLANGFQEVYQLQQGILNYFKEIGADHYDGECFVFDERIAVNSRLEVSGTTQCKICQGPIKPNLAHCCNR